MNNKIKTTIQNFREKQIAIAEEAKKREAERIAAEQHRIEVEKESLMQLPEKELLAEIALSFKLYNEKMRNIEEGQEQLINTVNDLDNRISDLSSKVDDLDLRISM